MATFKSANTSFKIPDTGDIFIPTNPQGINPMVYVRDGQNVKALDLQALAVSSAGGLVPCGPSNGYSCFADTGERINNASQVWERGIKLFKEQTGKDYYSLPQQNIADVQAAFGRGANVSIQSLNSIDEFKTTVTKIASPGTNDNIDISQGQSFDATTKELKDSTGKVIGTAQPNTNQTLPVAPEGFNASATVVQAVPPTANLQPGDSGAEVKKLQDYLVSKGFMTQAQVDTGYGTYGPQTTAGVSALQKSLGVDNSSGVGYFGPRTIAAMGSSAPTSAPNTGNGTDSPATVDPELLKILANPNLSADQKASIQAIFNAVSSNDADTAGRLKSAMSAASEFSDPYFKAQIQLATDALERGISGKDGDLAFSETQLRNALKTLQENTTASKDQLSFTHARELKQLEDKYKTDIEDTQTNLAATGFTASSRRARAEKILEDNNTGLVESSNKGYSYQTGNLDRTLNTSDVSTQNQIANLRRLASEGKLDLLRSTEEKVGSDTLGSLGYNGLLGNVGGSIPRQKALDSFSFASNSGFVF